ncbi:hypothetical protein GCM10010271_21890 [Streptomyces kurssanovii]|nr:hypothetical protein GCM10010271_21890 [Streptomyces kurssanovii]
MNHVTDEQPGYRADFVVGAHSARHLRRILRAYLTSWELLEVAEAAELALTELIANVVRHVPGRRCQTLILLQDGGVRVEVSDASPVLPRSARADLTAEGGRGLLLVEALTDRWGTEERPAGSGKTVWFECAAKPAGTGGR